jgi:two-component system, OmpR family, response regulator BaeR
MSGKILIVEDELKLSALLRDYLNQSSYETECVFRGDEAVNQVKKYDPDLVLLDLNLPGRDGLDICKDLRAFSAVPIIMITARVEEIDRLLGLELGADDYICKPFSPREVVARVKTVLRRSAGFVPQMSGLTLDQATYKASINGQALDLTAVEFNLLQLLASHPGHIYNRQQLMDKIYPDGRIVTDRAIDTHVKKLRRKIARVMPGQELIYSIYSVGYKFEWHGN